jgi:hypothetical protein
VGLPAAQLTTSHSCCYPCHRTENIFKQLDERSLTEDEENIIQQRVRSFLGTAVAR